MDDEDSVKLLGPVSVAMREAGLHLDTHNFGDKRDNNKRKVSGDKSGGQKKKVKGNKTKEGVTASVGKKLPGLDSKKKDLKEIS